MCGLGFTKTNMNFSQEYLGAIVILLVQVLKMFGVELATEEVTTIVTGAVALWVAIRRFSKGDINMGGVKQ